jgi:hypothetical protein
MGAMILPHNQPLETPRFAKNQVRKPVNQIEEEKEENQVVSFPTNML